MRAIAYQALYRTWRSTKFSQLVGQDAIGTTLRNQIASGRIAHAYLFCGSRGTGKTSTAKIFARAVSCENPQEGDLCGVCPTCVSLAEDTNMDIVEIDAASNNGVDEIRDLREKVKYPPSVGKYRVYIIDEVHMLSTGAFNALLKTLEEPPAHVIFLLATTEPQKLPATILSRCQRFDFRRISVKIIVERLQLVLSTLHVQAEDVALERIARSAQGGMRDALSLLDLCLSYTNDALTDTLVREVLGAADDTMLFEYTAALLFGDTAAALRHIDALMRGGYEPAIFLRDVTGHIRALLLAKVCGDDLADLVEITSESAAQYQKQAQEATQAQLLRMLSLCLDTENEMKWSSSPRFSLELCASKICHPENENSALAMEQRLARLEDQVQNAPVRTVKDGKSASGSKHASAPMSTAPVAASTPAPATGEDLFRRGLATIKKEYMSVYTMLNFAASSSVTQESITIYFAPTSGIYREVLSKEENLQKLRDAFTKEAGRPMAVLLQMQGEEKPKETNAASLLNVFDAFGRENVRVTETS